MLIPTLFSHLPTPTPRVPPAFTFGTPVVPCETNPDERRLGFWFQGLVAVTGIERAVLISEADIPGRFTMSSEPANDGRSPSPFLTPCRT
jgi:hypothetical protein